MLFQSRRLLNTFLFAVLGLTALQGSAATAQEQSHFHELDQPVAQATTVITPQETGPQGTYIVMEKYQLRSGEKVSEAIADWCKRNNWSLAWDATEIISEADLAIDGQFELVVEMLLDALNRSGAKINAAFYDGNRVLRITEKK